MGPPRPTAYGHPLPCFGLCGSSCLRERSEKRTKPPASRQKKCPARLAMRGHLLSACVMTRTARPEGKRVTLSATAGVITDAQRRRVLDGTDEKRRTVL